MEDLGEQVGRKLACAVGSDLPSGTAPPADSTPFHPRDVHRRHHRPRRTDVVSRPGVRRLRRLFPVSLRDNLLCCPDAVPPRPAAGLACVRVTERVALAVGHPCEPRRVTGEAGAVVLEPRVGVALGLGGGDAALHGRSAREQHDLRCCATHRRTSRSRWRRTRCCIRSRTPSRTRAVPLQAGVLEPARQRRGHAALDGRTRGLQRDGKRARRVVDVAPLVLARRRRHRRDAGRVDAAPLAAAAGVARVRRASRVALKGESEDADADVVGLLGVVAAGRRPRAGT